MMLRAVGMQVDIDCLVRDLMLGNDERARALLLLLLLLLPMLIQLLTLPPQVFYLLSQNSNLLMV